MKANVDDTDRTVLVTSESMFDLKGSFREVHLCV